MAILALPSEILIQIYNFSQPLLEAHNRLDRQLRSQCEQYGPMQADNDYEHPINLLHSICERPFIAKYIKSAGFSQYTQNLEEDGDGRAKMDACNGGLDLLQASSQIDKALVSQDPKLRSQDHVPLVHHDKRDWHQRILAGEVGPAITLLLTLLPSLTSLYLWDTWEYRRQYLDSIMMTIAWDIINAPNSDPISPALPLAKLRKFHIHTQDNETGTPLQTLAPFIALPSLQDLSGEGLEADYTPYKWPFPESQVSTVESITLTNSAISASNMQKFLSPLKNLKSFHYSHTAMGNGAGYLWNGGACLNTIIAHLGPTLEKLHFTGDVVMSCTAIETFKPFDRLKILEFSAQLLMGEVDEGKGDEYLRQKQGYFPPEPKDITQPSSYELWGLLPESLEELTIRIGGVPSDCKALLDAVYADQNKMKEIHGLPNLHYIKLRH